MNSKCGVQSNRRCESHEPCICIVGFSAFLCPFLFSYLVWLLFLPCHFSTHTVIVHYPDFPPRKVSKICVVVVVLLINGFFFCMALVEHVGDDSWYYLLLMVGGVFSLLPYIYIYI